MSENIEYREGYRTAGHVMRRRQFISLTSVTHMTSIQ